MFADVVIFDPATIADRATYTNPHQYAVGVKHVLVNGVAVLRDDEHTGALPARALYGFGRRVPASTSGITCDGRDEAGHECRRALYGLAASPFLRLRSRDAHG